MIPLIIVILLAVSAVCSATETAFSSVNRIRLKNLAADGNANAQKALDITNNFDKALTAILIANNIANIASSALATVFFTEKFGSGSVGLATIVMTVLVLVFGEILPKSMAKENSESFSIAVAPLLSVFIFITTPLIAVFSGVKKIANKLAGPKDHQPSVTEEELMHIINEIEDEGVLEEQESDLVKSALEFDEITIGEVLVPRVNVQAVEINDSVDEIKDVFMQTKYSRLPVYEKTIDNIVGIIHQTDFYELYLNFETDVKKIMNKPIYLSENKTLSQALHEMQKAKMHLCVVVDQHGGTEGICTLEDILEELVGEIYDESDEEDTSFIKLGENRYQVSADFSVNDFLDRLDLPEKTIQTERNSIGGWIMELIDRLPEQNEFITYGPFNLTVFMEDEQKIDYIKVRVKTQENQEESKNAKAD